MKAKLIAALVFLLSFGALAPEKAEAGRYYVGGGYYVTRTVGYDYYGRPIVRRFWVDAGPRYYAPPVRHYHSYPSHRYHAPRAHYHRGHNHHNHHRSPGHHRSHGRSHGKHHRR